MSKLKQNRFILTSFMEKPNSQIKIPEDWQKVKEISTRTDLLKDRKSKNIPDISFDLDGDGVVGGYDLVISSQFDHDKDGKLNSQEREQAMKALSQGYSTQFVWGCESSGLNRSFRLVQKRGKVIDNEEFTSLDETYPKFHSSDKPGLTRSRLHQLRKEKDQEAAKIIESKLKTVTSTSLPIDSFLCHENFVEFPNYSSMNEKRQIEIKKMRERAGLRQETQDIIKSEQVKFSYEQTPKNLSFTDMKTRNREKLIDQLNSSVDYAHMTFYNKVEKEKSYVSPPGKILGDIQVERKNKDIDHLEQTFTHAVQGIHGKELPKFEKNLDLFSEMSPYVTSNRFFNPFENSHHQKFQTKLEEIPKKPTQVSHDIRLPEGKNNISSKFTDYYSQFMPHGGRSQEIYKERMKLGKIHQIEKKQFKFLQNLELTPPITQRLLQKSSSPNSKFKSITSTGFNFK